MRQTYRSFAPVAKTLSWLRHGSSLLLFLGTGVAADASESRLIAGDAGHLDRFGKAVAVDGGWAVVGAPRAKRTSDGARTGAAYVFARSNGSWQQTQKLEAPLGGGVVADPMPFDDFGTAVALFGNYIAIGAPLHHHDDTGSGGSDAGAVYLYRFDGADFTFERKITAHDADDLHFFGSSLALQTHPEDPSLYEMVVGAPGYDVDIGAIYVYQMSGGPPVERGPILPPDASISIFTNQPRMGASVDISGDRIVAGGPNHNADDPGTPDIGAAYIFRRQGIEGSWPHDVTYSASDGMPEDLFASAVAIDDDVVVVGSPKGLLSNSTSGLGKLYVFRWVGGMHVEEKILAASDEQGGDRFGHSLDIRGDTVVVGAPDEDELGNQAGAVYVYEHTISSLGAHLWSETAILNASDAVAGARYGISVALDDDGTLAVGARDHIDGGVIPGRAYVHDRIIFADGFESGATSRWSATLP